MEHNSLDDLLGQMKNKFNTPGTPKKEAIDSFLTVSPEICEKEEEKMENSKSVPNSDEHSSESLDLIKEKKIHINEDLDKKIDKTRGNTKVQVPNNTVHLKTGKTTNKSSKTSLEVVPQNAKRTSKRRPTQSDGSIIQSAIARKEKSFEDYAQPKSRNTKKTKSRVIPVNKNNELTSSHDLIQEEPVKTLSKSPSPDKKSKRGQSDAEKGDIEGDSLTVFQEANVNFRRSQRTLSSDQKGETSSDSDGKKDELHMAQLNARLCRCVENKGIFMETESVTGPNLTRLPLPSTFAKMSFETSKKISNCDADAEMECDSPPLVPVEQLQMLINNKEAIDVNECNEYELIEAVESDNLERVAAILGSGNIDLKARLGDYNNGSFLHLVVLKSSIQMAYLFISASIDLDLLDKEQNSSLMLAVAEHKNGFVKYLLKAGADVTLKGTDGMTALHIAAKCGNLEACQILLASSFGISNFVNFQDDGGWTPLVWACEHGHVDIAKYLVSKGADVNIRDVEHNVALHWAAFSGSSQIVELLLNWKCDVNVVNVHGDTPLHIGAREDKYNCVIILLGRKADVSLVNKNNETPLDCVPKDGKCLAPIALNVQLGMAVSTYSDEHKCLLTNDISRGREVNPIQCYNSVDSEQEPRNYTYVKRNCISSDNIKVNTKVPSIQSCSCDDRCLSSECSCGRLSLRCWYDGEGKLLPEFNFCDPPLIFECNDLCSCNAILCVNRLVQKPMTQRFQLFKTNFKGWGIRTLNFIARGNYVCEYTGEILLDTEADQREDDSYLFDLDNKDTESFCIDAKYYGNFARFINHSCDPNLHPVKVFIEHHDLRFPRIVFFAKRDIVPDEELSFDYGDKFWLVKYKSFTCGCGTDVCKYSEETIKSTLEKYHMVT